MKIAPVDWRNPSWGCDTSWCQHAKDLQEIWHTFNDDQAVLLSSIFYEISQNETE